MGIDHQPGCFCKGVGFVVDMNLPKGHRTVECPCYRDVKANVRVANSGILPAYFKLSCEDIVRKDSLACQNLQKYVAQAEKSVRMCPVLLLHGPAKAGRTLLAACTIQAIIQHGYSCRIGSLSSILTEMKQCDNSDNAQEVLDKYCGADVTFSCIDDISHVLDGLKTVRTGHLSQQPIYGPDYGLVGILKKRASLRLPTIMTSRVDKARLGAVFPDIAAEMFSWLEIKCDFADVRMPGNDQMMKEFGFDRI